MKNKMNDSFTPTDSKESFNDNIKNTLNYLPAKYEDLITVTNNNKMADDVYDYVDDDVIIEEQMRKKQITIRKNNSNSSSQKSRFSITNKYDKKKKKKNGNGNEIELTEMEDCKMTN